MAHAEPLSLHELSELLPRLQATVESLQRLTAAPTRSREPKPRGKSPADGQKFSREEGQTLRNEILRALSAKGAKVSSLAETVRAPVEAVRYHLKVLRDQKKVGMKGARATAEWFARRK